MRILTPLLTALALVVSAPLALAADNAVGEVLTKAHEADGMKRVPKESYFEGSDGTALIYFEFKPRKDHVKTEFVEFKKDGSWKGERGYVEYGGSLRELEFATGKGMADPAPAGVLKGEVKEGKLVLKSEEGEPKTVALPESALTPLPLAVLVLPAYYEFLPKELPFAVVLDKRVVEGFKLVKGAEKDGLQLVTLMGPEKIKIEIHVSTAAETKGKIVKLVAVGKTNKNIGREEGSKRIEAMVKAAREAAQKKAAGEAKSAASGPGAASAKAGVEALIQACAAGDMKAAGACFSSKAPGEFQSLIDGTCSAKDFKQLCSLFDKAKITGVTADPKDAKVAYVSVKLTKRDEKLTMVKEAKGWKILDF